MHEVDLKVLLSIQQARYPASSSDPPLGSLLDSFISVVRHCLVLSLNGHNGLLKSLPVCVYCMSASIIEVVVAVVDSNSVP